MNEKSQGPQMTTPKTKLQGLFYGLFMCVFMSLGMELYNNAVKMGVNLLPGGFSSMTWAVVPAALSELWFIIPVVFVISNAYGNRLGAKLAAGLIDPERDSSFFRSCVVIACTTLVMCPSMSLFASVLFNVVLAGRPAMDLPMIWIGTVFKNFPMALLWNLFAASPMSRLCLKWGIAAHARVQCAFARTASGSAAA
jgi:cation transporter-like permease